MKKYLILFMLFCSVFIYAEETADPDYLTLKTKLMEIETNLNKLVSEKSSLETSRISEFCLYGVGTGATITVLDYFKYTDKLSFVNRNEGEILTPIGWGGIGLAILSGTVGLVGDGLIKNNINTIATDITNLNIKKNQIQTEINEYDTYYDFLKTNKINTGLKYLSLFPNGVFNSQIESRIKEIAAKRYSELELDTATIEIVNSYLADIPLQYQDHNINDLKTSIMKKQQKSVYDECILDNTVLSYDNFIKEHPDSPYVEDIKNRINMIYQEWQKSNEYIEARSKAPEAFWNSILMIRVPVLDFGEKDVDYIFLNAPHCNNLKLSCDKSIISDEYILTLKMGLISFKFYFHHYVEKDFALLYKLKVSDVGKLQSETITDWEEILSSMAQLFMGKIWVYSNYVDAELR